MKPSGELARRATPDLYRPLGRRSRTLVQEVLGQATRAHNRLGTVRERNQRRFGELGVEHVDFVWFATPSPSTHSRSFHLRSSRVRDGCLRGILGAGA
jgi:hypothetical protein